MLRHLRLKNLALIDELAWDLGPGLNILTGETGAGKSILIDGLNLLLGQRADRTLIRSGEDSCLVEAVFELEDRDLLARLNARLEAGGAEACDGPCLLLKRTLSAGGSNRQFANGSPVTLALLKELGDELVDLHGPHDHQSLLHADRQLDVLDAYGQTEKARAAYAAAYREWTGLRAWIEELRGNQQQREQRLEMLRYQLKEIDAVAPEQGEDERLANEHRTASHAREILELCGGLANLLSENEDAVINQLARTERELSRWAQLDERAADLLELNGAAIANLQELVGEIAGRAESVDLNAERLHELEGRLGDLHKLKRKYGPGLDEVIAHAANAREELATLEGDGGDIGALEAKAVELEAQTLSLGAKLTKARAKTAKPLAKETEAQLRELGFAQAHFCLDLADCAEPGPTGLDRVEFILAPNPGEEPRPLRAIASSGEMARVMLAIKTTLAKVDRVPTLIFDEVDANVGGETATAVGRRLREVGGSHQVLCITHLPPVAAAGHRHFAVRKAVRAKRSLTTLELLEGSPRREELARMLGGQTAKSLELASSLLQSYP
ncbi:MAG: DNA repair protein RecN [Verrucomicrobiota bacterium]